MKFSLTRDGKLSLEYSTITLHDLQPVINGVLLTDIRTEIVQHDASGTVLCFTVPALAGAFGVELTRETRERAVLRYWLEGPVDAAAINSFGFCFQRIHNLRAYLRNGYYSWDGSFYVEPEAMRDWEEYEQRPETGYAMTQLLPRCGKGVVVVGFDRHDRFQQTFTVNTRTSPPSLTIQTLWDRKAREGTDPCSSERLYIFEHNEVEEGLREWARLVLAAAPVKPRILAPITGWCSWYNLYAYITEENILEHLRGVTRVARRHELPMRVFQIDDGFTPEMGDWLEVKPSFPRGMKPLLDDIRAAGFIPGLWIAPFMVGNQSRVYREHPDWVVGDNETGGPLVQKRFYGEFRWHKRSEEYYILDTTNPKAFEYLRRVFRTWRHEWGCEYFKTDFMYYGAAHGPEHAKYHTPGWTRIEIWRRVAEMIRSEIGDAVWLGCGIPLWAGVGLVDGVRIGGDVRVEWRSHSPEGGVSAESLLRDQATRNFGNGILWQSDPDCILLRERFHYLSDTELRSLALYAGMAGGVITTSDALDELSPERLRLLKLLLRTKPSLCRFPFLGQSPIRYERLPAGASSHFMRHEPVSDPVLVQVSGEPPCTAVFVFNTGETPVERTFTLDTLGLSEAQYLFDWTAGRALGGPLNSISVTLPPHDGALLFASASPIVQPPERLP